MNTYRLTMSLSFFHELQKLPSQVRQRAEDAVDRMAQDPWAMELHPEKIKRAEDGIHSSRVDQSYRVIWKHIKPNDVVLCLVDKHDQAYRRALRQSFTLQDGIVQIADVVNVKSTAPDEPGGLFSDLGSKKRLPGKLFVTCTDKDLLNMGVPPDLLMNLRALDDVNEFARFENILEEEVFDQLLEIALDIVDRPVVSDKELHRSLAQHQGGEDLYQFIDTEEFKRVLQGTLEEWMLFLAPYQRQIITRDFSGSGRIRGVAGSGKTVIAVHRFRRLLKDASTQNKKVLFLTYGNKLPPVIDHLVRQLAGQDAPELAAAECVTIHQWCRRFLKANGRLREIEHEANFVLADSINRTRPRYPDLTIWSRSSSFFKDEISFSIKGRALKTLDEYLSLDRSGRGSALRDRERRAVYEVYENYTHALRDRNTCDFDDWILLALELLQQGTRPSSQYMAAVVDEIQDLTTAEMKLIRLLIPQGPNDLFLVGDGLQKLYPGGYSLRQVGIDIQGRSLVLSRNYRNTHEILRAAHSMMRNREFDDLDDSPDNIPEPELSVRHGPLPIFRTFTSTSLELDWIAEEIRRLKNGESYEDRDFAVLYRSRQNYQDQILEKLAGAVQLVELEKNSATYFGPYAKHATYDGAKGLEFKVVFVVGASDTNCSPHDADKMSPEELADHLTREQQRLYVAMTRARDLLYVTCSGDKLSRFLETIPPRFVRRM